MKSSFAVLLLLGFAVYATAVGGGHSVNNHKQDDYGNYQFSYHITDGLGAKNYRHESGAPGVKKGSYGFVDIDGRARHVNYIADHYGFRAKIASNEPGVAQKDAAHAAYGGGGFV
ncbi:adult-specific rigid cuticular protein 15.7-like [Galendromus occidentalis]|uniref:Adult-specific rigid cuticular protein 15.7-like n=1 Tax=Galendromus occidentalis TaxID=34638 RepID=A0AAJ6VWJ1_9ACAR|nr:adult-specific rigid cuticular protein 15.7-like [Galendromus occidentalis]